MKYTDNVRFNHKLNLVMFLGFGFFLLGRQTPLVNCLIPALKFTAIYAFASAFIQPDLDQAVQRPGKDTFPLGSFKCLKLGKILSTLLLPINRIWYYFWQPYGYLWTHRGFSHWPVVGTWTRAGYSFIVFFSLSAFFHFPKLTPVIQYLRLFFPSEGYGKPWTADFTFWMTYVLPFFISDSIHFLVDLFDSIKNNTPFQSYAHAPGVFKQAFNPKIMKFHKKALKKAKSNKRKMSP